MKISTQNDLAPGVQVSKCTRGRMNTRGWVDDLVCCGITRWHSYTTNLMSPGCLLLCTKGPLLASCNGSVPSWHFSKPIEIISCSADSCKSGLILSDEVSYFSGISLSLSAFDTYYTANIPTPYDFCSWCSRRDQKVQPVQSGFQQLFSNRTGGSLIPQLKLANQRIGKGMTHITRIITQINSANARQFTANQGLSLWNC